SVRFAPQADSTVATNRTVFGLDPYFLIQRADDLGSLHRNRQRMPFGIAGSFDASQLNPLPVDNFIHAERILQRVMSSDVVGPGILRTPDDAAPLIDDSF